MSKIRLKMTIQGSGVLQDGSRYTRELSITDTLGRERLIKEVSAEKIEIEGETCEFTGVRVNGVMLEEEVKDESITDGAKFDPQWEKLLGGGPGFLDNMCLVLQIIVLGSESFLQRFMKYVLKCYTKNFN